MSFIQRVIWAIVVYIVAKFLFRFVFSVLDFLGIYSSSDKADNPFENDSSQPVRAKVHDQKQRDTILKQNFKYEKVPENLDAIIIGSGIGGMTTAAILSKAHKKVLVLEQHDQAGGTCHTFIEKGYEFDVGIHYIGQMNKQTINKTLFDQISEGQVEWADLDDNYDTVLFKDGDRSESFPLFSSVEKTKKSLKKDFPAEEKAIDRYFDIIDEINGKYQLSVFVKFVPLLLVKILDFFGIVKYFTNFYEWNKRTVQEVSDELTNNQTLKDIFSYCFGDYGTVPSEAGMPMQALLMSHFQGGASYPVGGASEIAHSIIPVIEKAGGKVFVNAEVSNILIDDTNKAYGVKVKHGTQTYDIKAPIIISNAGIYNTVQRFLPQEIAEKSRLYPFVQKTKHGVAAISIFVGLDAPAEELEVAINKNYWVFTKKNINQTCIDYLGTSKEKCEDADVPLQFISFPSTKDPTWEQRFPGKTTMAIVTLANYEWFAEWEQKPCLRRGDDYEAVKKTIGHKCIDHACQLFPKIKDHIDYVNIGTPLSNNFYLGTMKGEIYGLDHTKNRFSLANNALLRPETDIEGLYLTGQDVSSCGFSGALWGGAFCAQQLLGRNIIADLTKLHKKIRKQQKQK